MAFIKNHVRANGKADFAMDSLGSFEFKR